ncbi:aminotransferase class I/II-fold pyridoxal phosphate-dependent enzyme [Calidifontibacillus oryziterrae]|uniref:aminotransferase class I/II-fold pyridoxal phosphate-dependent enzyme n=1 Tax=Calidifontibacillus oryziterrae TaxID=1191699 RepID=UPI00031BEAFD|nr:aminotransferase class I/II-fold pyridoxal phosphate-dependent enzyme [Calidifontibacillus oryziterrae]
MNQNTVPLYQGLLNHKNSDPISFHVPGHKNGAMFKSVDFGTVSFNDLLRIDLTELNGLDDLHSPTSIIKEAQHLTADLYKVKKSYFLVGGSTAGNLAMILATCNPHDVVLVQRNSHKSIMNSLQLANVRPVFLSPEFDYESQIATNISYETVKQAIKDYPEAKALILTTPNYYGMVSHNLNEIIKLANSAGLLVLVDEAHGAHFILGKPFPTTAVTLGADIVVQSAHKTLPAMTMGSYLHFNSSRIDIGKVEYYLQVVQSSSPSYPIMASLDLARYYLAHISNKDKEEIIDSIENFRESLARLPQINLIAQKSDLYQADILKIIVQSNCALTGYEIQEAFEKEHIYTELADPWNVLFVCPLSEVEDYSTIVAKVERAIKHVPTEIRDKQKVDQSTPSIFTLAITYEEMRKRKTCKIPLRNAVGEIAASSVIPYPPGIPVILPGETITNNHINMLLTLKESGAYFQNNPELWDKGIDIFN